MSKYINKFWVSLTAVLTIILLIYLFPIMYDQYGFIKAILLSLCLIFGMSLYYIRGYWISKWLSKKKSSPPGPSA
jgi:hypothetical protein